MARPRAPGLRAAAPAAVVAALLACSVDVNGAPCTTPGATTDCPSGQACGNDLHCSERAFACREPSARCVPGTDGACSGTVSRRCTDADPVCGRWVDDDCGARGLVCGLRGTSGCECPEWSGAAELVADAARGSPDANAPPYPRGQANPPECRFGRLWDALQWTSVFGSAAATVTASGTFGDADPAHWPLVVDRRTTLAAASGGDPAVIRGDPSVTGAGELVRVDRSFQGFRVEGGGATGAGVRLLCATGAADRPVVSGISVDGGGPSGRLAIGIAVGGGTSASASCGGRVVAASVTGASDTALDLAPVYWGTVDVVGGSFGGTTAGAGITLRSGTVTVAPDPAAPDVKVRVAGNATNGVLFDASLAGTIFDATLQGLDVAANGASAIATYAWLPSAAKVRIRGSDVHGNGRALASDLGGIALRVDQGSVALLELSGSRIWSNAGAQVALAPRLSPLAVGVAPGSCGAASNWIGCTGTGVAVSNLGSSGAVQVYGTFLDGPLGPNVSYSGPVCTGAEVGFPPAPACE